MSMDPIVGFVPAALGLAAWSLVAFGEKQGGRAATWGLALFGVALLAVLVLLRL